MTKKRGLIFDFDDTLVYTHRMFEAARAECIDYLKSLGVTETREELYDVINQADIASVQKVGYFAAHCFPESLSATYKKYCELYGFPYDPSEAERLYQLGARVYTDPVEQFPYAEELLQEVSQEHHIVLLTQGDKTTQVHRIERSGLQKYFDDIMIVEQKNEEYFRKILQRNNWQAAQTWMIGNSIKSDINPALRCGIPCILITSEDLWSYEEATLEGDCYQINDLRDCLTLIKKGERE